MKIVTFASFYLLNNKGEYKNKNKCLIPTHLNAHLSVRRESK